MRLDLKGLGHLDRSVRLSGRGKVAAEVVADRSESVAAKPLVGLDGAARGCRDGERSERRGPALGSRAGLTEDELDAALLKLMAYFVAELLFVGTGEDVRLGLEYRDLLLWPAGVDLACEFESGRAGADDQDSPGTR